jgi:hypothetical protein
VSRKIEEMMPTLSWSKEDSWSGSDNQYIFAVPFENSIVPTRCSPGGEFKLQNIRENEKEFINRDSKLSVLLKEENKILVLDKSGKHFLYKLKPDEHVGL